MSLKAIDGQLAMSRTAETSQIQQQLVHKPEEDQAALAAQFRRQLEEERQKSARLEQKSAPLVRDEGQRGSNGRQAASGKSGRERKEKEVRAAEHPYKGRHIDITL